MLSINIFITQTITHRLLAAQELFTWGSVSLQSSLQWDDPCSCRADISSFPSPIRFLSWHVSKVCFFPNSLVLLLLCFKFFKFAFIDFVSSLHLFFFPTFSPYMAIKNIGGTIALGHS